MVANRDRDRDREMILGPAACSCVEPKPSRRLTAQKNRYIGKRRAGDRDAGFQPETRTYQAVAGRNS